MRSDSVNPYEPPTDTPSEVTHHFNWRSHSTTLRLGAVERHQVTVRFDFFTNMTTILVDGEVVMAFRYVFIPPEIQFEIGRTERHQIEMDLNQTLFRHSRVAVDGQTMELPLLPTRLVGLLRCVTIFAPVITGAVFVTSYFMERDWVDDLLICLMVAVTLLLVALAVFDEYLGWIRIKRVDPLDSGTPPHAPPRPPNAR